MEKKEPAVVLVAVLNWGLGHAARSIPLVASLLRHGARVVLASDGGALDLLREAFPDLPRVALPAYDIRYKGKSMFWNMARQDHKILRAAWREHRLLRELVPAYGIHIVLSDNRYGCFHPATRNIMMTHQLRVIVPGRLFGWAVNALNRRVARWFDACWVPDYPAEPSLSGELSHTAWPVPVRYIGPLSRFSRYAVPEAYDVLLLLSGPEPQRTVLERLLVAQARMLPLRFLLVRGVPGAAPADYGAAHIRSVSHLGGKALNDAILASRVVVARSGYSTIMDLVAAGSKAILIPTPGQTEQEYLAARFGELGLVVVQAQDRLDLAAALETVAHTQGFGHWDQPESLFLADAAVRELLETYQTAG